MALMNYLSHSWTRRSASALVLSGAGLAGVAGCALNMSPGEKIVASAQADGETDAPVHQSALSRLLKKPSEEPVAEDQVESTSRSTTTIGRGRLFSAIVDRFPGRKKDTVDPFLEAEIEAERHRAHIVQSEDKQSTSDRARTRSALAQSQPRVRTDEQLWELFDDDAAAVVKTRPDPTLKSEDAAARPFPVAEIQKPRKPEEAPETHQPGTARRSGAGSVAAVPASRSESGENPFAKFLREEESVNDTSNVAGAALQELQDLLSPSPQRERQNTGSAAERPVAGGPASRPSPFETTMTDPTAGAARGLEQRRPSSINDPFGGGSVEAASTVAQGISPFASGSSIGSALPWTTRIQPAATMIAGSGSHVAAKSGALPFPATPEWQSVRANSPVSLAVIEQPEPTISSVERTAVRHALIEQNEAPLTTPGRLLPRHSPNQDMVFDRTGETLAFSTPSTVDGPLLAPPATANPVLVAPAPPMAATADAAGPLAIAAADEELTGRKSYGGWILGAMMLVVGLCLMAFRSRQPIRRHLAARQK